MSIRVGVRIPACVSLVEYAVAVEKAETLGFDAVWVPDSQLLWRDTYAALSFAAARTSTIRLGTGVTNLKTRHPSVVASAANTAHELAPGRIRLAIGTGDSSVKLVGERPSRQVETREGIAVIRALLAGDDWNFGKHDVHLKDARGPIPLFLAASGPKNVALAGEIGDGALLMGGASTSLAKQNLELLKDGAASVGRTLEGFDTTVAAFCHVTDDPERDAGMLKPLCATVALTGGADALGRAGIQIDPSTIPPSPYPDYSHVYDVDEAVKQLDDVISDEVALRFAEEFCLFGSASKIAGQISELERLGVSELYLRHVGSYEVPHELIESVADQVLPVLSPSGRGREAGVAAL